MQVQRTQDGHLYIMTAQNQPVYVASAQPQFTSNNGILYVADINNQWAALGPDRQAQPAQAVQIPMHNNQGYPQAAQVPVQQQRPNVHHQNPYLPATKEDPRLSGAGKVATIVRGQQQSQPQQIPGASIPTQADLNRHYAAMAMEQAQGQPAQAQQQPVQQPVTQTPPPAAPEPVATPAEQPPTRQHTVGTYLLNSLTGKYSDLSVNYAALKAYQLAATFDTDQLKTYVEDLLMDAKRHATLYPAGTSDSNATSNALQLEALPEVLTELDHESQTSVVKAGDIEAAYYTIARYSAIETSLGDRTVITSMMKKLSTTLEVLTRTYNDFDVELGTTVEIRGMDNMLTRLVNLYLKHVLKLPIELDSIRREYAELDTYANEGTIPGLDNDALRKLSAFILSTVSFNSETGANITDDEDPALHVDLHYIEINAQSADLGLSENLSPVTGEPTSTICSPSIHPVLYKLLDAYDKTNGAKIPVVQNIRTRDSDFTAISVGGAWQIISTDIV